jgi:hypothetical protein
MALRGSVELLSADILYLHSLKHPVGDDLKRLVKFTLGAIASSRLLKAARHDLALPAVSYKRTQRQTLKYIEAQCMTVLT